MASVTRQPTSGAVKLLCLLMLLVFLLAAGVQLNDPDPAKWIVIYLLSAVCCLGFLFGRGISALSMLVAIVALIWSMSLMPSVVGEVSMKEIFDSITMKNQSVEEAREIGGLLLISLWNFFLASR